MLSWRSDKPQMKLEEVPFPPKVPSSSSLNSQEIVDVVRPEIGATKVLDGMCRSEPLTDTGKRLQLLKILSLTLLPILGLWAFTVYSLSDSIQGKFDIEQTQYAVEFSVEIGMFLDRIQRERDMSVLYLSILGPETKTFLMNEYLLTDQALDHLSDWPVRNDIQPIFQSRKEFKKFLNEHRQNLDPNNYDIYVEMEFYSFLIERFIEWMYGAIKESNMASIWKILVAYQKIVTVMEHIGIERALGTVFYVEGGFPTQSVYERYNNRVNIFKANYRSAVLYSKAVDPIFQEGVTATGTNLTAVIERFRFEIQHTMNTDASITKGQWWFDNMTLYLDTLLIIQQELAGLINGQLEEIIQAEEKNLTISACFLVIVILMCPLVIYTVEALTSDIQKYAIALVHKTKELSKEKKKMDELLYQMVPRPVADRLKMTKEVDAEYFKSVTIMFSDIFGFTRISQECSPLEIVNLLNVLYTEIDERLDHYDVYKVEAINDSYMVASGLPTRIGNRHSAEVANLALDLLSMVMDNRFTTPMERMIQLRIGINTGPCMAGIVGTIMPRYCLFGDAVNTASRMKSYGSANKIHISPSTYNSLRKHGVYVMAHRGKIMVKGKGSMMTYWLLTRTGNDVEAPSNMAATTASETSAEEPGEVQANMNFSSGKFSMFGLSGVQPSLATQLGHNTDKGDCKVDCATSGGDAKSGGPGSAGSRGGLILKIDNPDTEEAEGGRGRGGGGGDGSKRSGSTVNTGNEAEDFKKGQGGVGGGGGGDDGEKGGQIGDINDDDLDGEKKDEKDDSEQRELPALSRLKILAKKVKDSAYEGDDDEGDEEGEDKEEMENGDGEDGDNDVFESDKKINKSERKKEESSVMERIE